MPYEPTEKRNPQQLTINQHIHSAHSIAKFYNANNKVEVKFLGTNEIVEKKKDAKLFCAKREWDQRAESSYMYNIETEFHKEIDSVKGFNERNHEAISEYCVLWRHRHIFHLSKTPDITLNGITGETLEKSKEEIAERKHAMFIREGGEVPSRFVSSFLIQREIDYAMSFTFKDIKWGLIEATEGEFLVADCYGDFPFMPISPTLAFWAQESDQKINKNQLSSINKISLEKATEFVFARSISACPIA